MFPSYIRTWKILNIKKYFKMSKKGCFQPRWNDPKWPLMTFNRSFCFFDSFLDFFIIHEVYPQTKHHCWSYTNRLKKPSTNKKTININGLWIHDLLWHTPGNKYFGLNWGRFSVFICWKRFKGSISSDCHYNTIFVLD